MVLGNGKGDGFLSLSRGRGERKRGLFLGRGDSRAKKNQRGKKRDFLRENLEKGVDFRLGILIS